MNTSHRLRAVVVCAFWISIVGAAPGARAAEKEAAGGRAEISTVYSGQPLEQRYSFNAVRRADGAVMGQWHLDQAYPDLDAMLQGRVTCVEVEGSTARVGGIIERSTNAFYQPGGSIIWTVTDVGEGNTPDMASYMLYTFSTDPAVHCVSDAGALPMFPSDRGNIRVRP